MHNTPMKNPHVKSMDIVSTPGRAKTQRRKSISTGVPTWDSREKDKDKKSTPTANRARRASMDSSVLGIGKLTLSSQKDKNSLNDISDSKSSEKRTGHSVSKKDKASTSESKYSLGKVTSSPKRGLSTSPSELKPILKSCARLTAIHASVSLEDISAHADDKLTQLPDSSKFCYRLPLTTTTTRKSVSFREDDPEEHIHRPRRYSSPSLQLPPSLNFPASKEFSDAVNSS